MDERLDRTATDRLLAGATRPGDASTEHGQLRALLDEAADLAPSEPPPALLAAMSAEARAGSGTARTPRSRPSLGTILTTKAAAAVAAVALTATGAAAANGSLPADAQDAVARAASHIGVDLPRPADDDVVDTSEPAVDGTEPVDTGQVDRGATVSTVARADHDSGRDRGDAVSDTAKTDQAPDAPPAGERPDEAPAAPVTTPDGGDAGSPDGDPAQDEAPVTTPNEGAAAHDAPPAQRPPPSGEPAPAADDSPAGGDDAEPRRPGDPGDPPSEETPAARP